MKLKEINLDDSFYARKQVESLIIIYNIVDKQKKWLEVYEQAQTEIEIIEKIRLITNEIYSGCEIINQLFISIYRNDDRYRGTNLKEVLMTISKKYIMLLLKEIKKLGVCIKINLYPRSFMTLETGLLCFMILGRKRHTTK